ncbi:MarC family protein [Endozoicomonas arenosclerae]|uniref:MarC family protein n=1 Tax=Endozoicomonas arenosclerae TaxID=1633495 RepID=UPI000783C8C0|nr:MarC family protein [Endozoicomonas arenosclerae]
MTELLSFAATVFVGFFAIMNPIANTPIFLGLTHGIEPAEKRKIAIQSNFLAFVIVSLFCLLGHVIFSLFGITLPAFRIAGGILVFLIGKDMLSGNNSELHTPSVEDNQRSLDHPHVSIAISPLAVPILGGPGTIATAMNFATGKGIPEVIICITVFGVLCGISCLFFLSGERFLHYIGESAVKVISRMMGLILAVIGTQLVIQGVYGASKLNL